MPQRPETVCLTLADGTREWRLAGRLHREGGPAIEQLDGANEWFKHGKRHREDGPAVRHPEGYKEWWLEDRQLTEAEFQLYFDKKSRAQETAEAEARKRKEEENRQLESSSVLQQRLKRHERGQFRIRP